MTASTETTATAEEFVFEGRTAAQWREAARGNRRDSLDSFDRCDTDGFATQAASDLTASLYNLKADIAEKGGVWEWDALFDLDGNLLPAIRKVGENPYNGELQEYWIVKEGWDYSSPVKEFFRPSQAKDPMRALATHRKKGYYVGTVLAPVGAKLQGAEGARGFSGMSSVYPALYRVNYLDPDVQVVDNGH